MPFVVKIIEAMLERIEGPRPTTFVETGTLGAGTTLKAAEMFERVYTIELSVNLYTRAVKKAKDAGVENITFLRGDSAVELPKLLTGLKEPVVLYLDAHFTTTHVAAAQEKPFPLWDELAAIAQRPYADLVIVDDTHSFGRAAEKDHHLCDWHNTTTKTIREALGVERTKNWHKQSDMLFIWMEPCPLS